MEASNASSVSIAVCVTVMYIMMCFIYLTFGVNSHRKQKLLLKCAPLLILIALVVFSLVNVPAASEPVGTGNIQKDIRSAVSSDTIRRMKILLCGLMFSCIGDGCLVFPPKVVWFGLLSFAVAQCIYTHLFGLHLDLVLNLPLQGIVSAACVALVSGTIMCGFQMQLKARRRTDFKLHPLIIVSIVVYFILISTMLWSAVLQLQLRSGLASALGAVGALLFYISDLLIAVSAVLKMRPLLLQGRALIMMTYYTAQLFISLSVMLLLYM